MEDTWEKLYFDTIALIDSSTRWLNNATEWEADERLGPMWQALYDRAGELRDKKENDNG